MKKYQKWQEDPKSIKTGKVQYWLKSGTSSSIWGWAQGRSERALCKVKQALLFGIKKEQELIARLLPRY